MTMAKEAENTAGGDDPFTRAIAREQAYRARRSRSGVSRLVFWFALAFVIGWGGLLSLHWTLLAEPRWLLVLHTIVFGITVLKISGAALFATMMGRSRGAFGSLSDDD